MKGCLLVFIWIVVLTVLANLVGEYGYSSNIILLYFVGTGIWIYNSRKNKI